MKMIIKYKLVLMVVLMWDFCLIFGCKSVHHIKEVSVDVKDIPVYSKSLLDISINDPRLAGLKKRTHSYTFLRDSFSITLLDMDKNSIFTDPKDVVVVHSISDSVAPIIPDVNINSAFFRRDLIFKYYKRYYKITDATADGKIINIEQNNSYKWLMPQILVTDKISNDLIISDLFNGDYQMLNNVITSLKCEYVLLYFWSPNCPPCFENIPKLKKLNSNGIAIINIYYMTEDERDLVKNQIVRFEIPGRNFISSPSLIKYFSQNGFPYSVLIDSSHKRILSSSHRLEDYENILNSIRK